MLIEKVQNQKPDLIVFTGDLVDARRKGDPDVCFALMQGLLKIAPVYLVTGNHDSVAPSFPSLADRLTEAGVHILRNETTILSRGDDEILLIGVDDPQFGPITGGPVTITRGNLTNALEDSPSASFKLLLFHRPELFPLFPGYGIDLTLSGHAHGGQIRLPFIGPLYAPGQGFFPKYTSGIYEDGSSVLVVSRGLGNSLFPQRLFNRPEIVVITLNSGS